MNVRDLAEILTNLTNCGIGDLRVVTTDDTRDVEIGSVSILTEDRAVRLD